VEPLEAFGSSRLIGRRITFTEERPGGPK
jgi:hypothetical protein